MAGRKVKATTFKVSPVEVARTPLPTLAPKQAIEQQTNRVVEACSTYHGNLVSSRIDHALFGAAHVAFASHRPLVLTPDAIWLTIAMGFATHGRKNAKRLRRLFVTHDRKAELEVRRDDFVRGSRENPWTEVFGQFSTQLEDRLVHGRHRELVPTFSTTGATERAAFEVALMASVQSYFGFTCVTLCGIPEVTLVGEIEDWERASLSSGGSSPRTSGTSFLPA